MAETPTFGRYAEIPFEQMTPEQQKGLRFVMEKRGQLPGPSKIYVHNPTLAKAIAPLGAHFRKTHSLTEREREIVVCVVTSHCRSAYPTHAHERAAKAAGLPHEQVDAILSGLPTAFADKREQVLYEMSICLTDGRWVSKGLYERAVEAHGQGGTGSGKSRHPDVGNIRSHGYQSCGLCRKSDPASALGDRARIQTAYDLVRYLSHRGILDTSNPAEFIIEAQLPVDAGD